MSRYHVAAVSFAIGCDEKWLDNVLSQTSIPGVRRERQGVSRTVDADAVLRVALAHRIARDIGLSIRRALLLADRLVVSGGRAEYPNGTVVSVELEELRGDLEERLLEAAEVLATPRRGRPPKPRQERRRTQ